MDLWETAAANRPVADDPVGHKAAIGTACNAEAGRVNLWIPG